MDHFQTKSVYWYRLLHDLTFCALRPAIMPGRRAAVQVVPASRAPPLCSSMTVGTATSMRCRSPSRLP